MKHSQIAAAQVLALALLLSPIPHKEAWKIKGAIAGLASVSGFVASVSKIKALRAKRARIASLQEQERQALKRLEDAIAQIDRNKALAKEELEALLDRTNGSIQIERAKLEALDKSIRKDAELCLQERASAIAQAKQIVASAEIEAARLKAETESDRIRFQAETDISIARIGAAEAKKIAEIDEARQNAIADVARWKEAQQVEFDEYLANLVEQRGKELDAEFEQDRANLEAELEQEKQAFLQQYLRERDELKSQIETLSARLRLAYEELNRKRTPIVPKDLGNPIASLAKNVIDWLFDRSIAVDWRGHNLADNAILIRFYPWDGNVDSTIRAIQKQLASLAVDFSLSRPADISISAEGIQLAIATMQIPFYSGTPQSAIQRFSHLALARPESARTEDSEIIDAAIASIETEDRVAKMLTFIPPNSKIDPRSQVSELERNWIEFLVGWRDSSGQGANLSSLTALASEVYGITGGRNFAAVSSRLKDILSGLGYESSASGIRARSYDVV